MEVFYNLRNIFFYCVYLHVLLPLDSLACLCPQVMNNSMFGTVYNSTTQDPQLECLHKSSNSHKTEYNQNVRQVMYRPDLLKKT